MKVKHSLTFSARWWSICDSDGSRLTSSFLFFFILLNLTFVWNSNANDKYIIALGNQKPMKISTKLMFWGAEFVHTWDLFVRTLFVSLYLPVQPLIRSSVHPSNSQILFHSLLLSGKLFPWTSTLKVTKIWLFFPLHTSLKSSADYTAYSCYHIYALLQAPFYSHTRVSFRDLKITAHRMTPLSSSFSLLQLVGGDLKFCFKTATVPILLNPPPSLPLVSPLPPEYTT